MSRSKHIFHKQFQSPKQLPRRKPVCYRAVCFSWCAGHYTTWWVYKHKNGSHIMTHRYARNMWVKNAVIEIAITVNGYGHWSSAQEMNVKWIILHASPLTNRSRQVIQIVHTCHGLLRQRFGEVKMVASLPVYPCHVNDSVHMTIVGVMWPEGILSLTMHYGTCPKQTGQIRIICQWILAQARSDTLWGWTHLIHAGSLKTERKGHYDI